MPGHFRCATPAPGGAEQYPPAGGKGNIFAEATPPDLRSFAMSKAPLFIISGPSGAGKTSLIKALLAEVEQLRFAVSHTTRAPRKDERDGADYHFVDLARFRRMIREDSFLEHAQVFDNWYGTSFAALEKARRLSAGVILEIDWQGACQVRQSVSDCCSIFILSPSMDALGSRLRERGKDSSEAIRRRNREAVVEVEHQHEFDHLIVNDDFAEALRQLKEIVAGRLADARQ